MHRFNYYILIFVFLHFIFFNVFIFGIFIKFLQLLQFNSTKQFNVSLFYFVAKRQNKIASIT